MQIASLSEGDHLVCDEAKFLGLSFRGGDAAILEKRSYETAQQSLASTADSSESTTCHFFPPIKLSILGVSILQTNSEAFEVCQFFFNFIYRFFTKVAYTSQFIFCLVHQFADGIDLGSLQAVECANGQFKIIDRELADLIDLASLYADIIVLCFSRNSRDSIVLCVSDVQEIREAADQDVSSRCALTDPSVSSSRVSLS